MLFITGIHDARQLGGFRPNSWMGRRRRIAIDLIEDIDRDRNPEARAALFERIVDVRGAFKRTYRDRFADFDARLLDLWRQSGPTADPLHVLDAAVSDGSTSLSLVAAVERLSGGAFRFTATDLDARYTKLWRKDRPQRRVILNEGGQIVQIVMPPFLFTHRESRYLFPVNRMLRPSAERFAEGLIEEWRRGQDDVGAKGLLLVNPEFRQLLEADSRVEFRTWDILHPWPEAKAHVVRAMNVLNPGYFDGEQMARVVRNLFDALADGGLLAIGSNDDAGSTVDGIICRRRSDRLESVESFGRGFRAPNALAGLISVSV